jgi:hypothetical protein
MILAYKSNLSIGRDGGTQDSEAIQILGGNLRTAGVLRAV